ncbi:hypothetical protein ACFPOE_01020 [Caenimonas terrae]|uniref:Hdr-like menaquinol oxidoreductase cytochrome c subunit n=1 Tax=Caenimonas terrae TaxID=696074 RepID=A0ABW0N761_9BURK
MRAVAAVLLALAATLAGGEVATRTPRPVIEPAARGGQCVADPAFMRRNHMDLLRHQRDDTVRAGVRGGQFSLNACIGCHASVQTGSVAKAETNFCVSCHSYAAVKIDCFECHASTPAPGRTAFHPLVPAGPAAAGALQLAAQVRAQGRPGESR